MKKLLKLANIGFYILMLLGGFIGGIYFAAAIDAGKNQGLAGGAIVLGYGLLFGGIAFILSFFIAYIVNLKTIVRINWVLSIILLLLWGYKIYEFNLREKRENEESEKFNPPPTVPTKTSEPTGMATFYGHDNAIPVSINLQNPNEGMGMGFFAPNYFENSVFYFYRNINLEKSILEHAVFDSITFKHNQYDQFEIATAPPWLVPEYLKMDYGFLYFKIESVSEDFVEIIVNKTNGQTEYVNRRAGKVIYWPEVLLSMNSVEFYPDSNEKIRVRSFEGAGQVDTPHEFMRAIQVKGEWTQVLLLDEDFKTVGKGWIQWKRNGKLLVTFNLLS